MDSERYVFDGGDADLRRLVAASELLAPAAEEAIRRSGIAAGWNVIECACGPAGVLPVLSGLVGETGRVAGLDINPETAERARAVSGFLGLDNVTVHTGNVYDTDPGQLGGPFDLAYVRLFLIHQPDPAEALRRIAGLLRPGGWIIAQEPPRFPVPRSVPRSIVMEDAWHFIINLIEGSGGQPDAAQNLGRSAADAGLHVVRLTGSFFTGSARQVFPLWAATVTATRDRAIAAGLTTPTRIDAVTSALTAEADRDYDWVPFPVFLTYLLRKPADT